MKILRVRRGFTTNSSASSEWVPPPWHQNLYGRSGRSSESEQRSESAGSREAQGEPGAAAGQGSAAGQGTTAAAPRTTAGASTQAGAAPATGASVQASAEPAAPAPGGHLGTNSAMFGLVVAGVVSAFVLERVVRRMVQKGRERSGSDD